MGKYFTLSRIGIVLNRASNKYPIGIFEFSIKTFPYTAHMKRY